MYLCRNSSKSSQLGNLGKFVAGCSQSYTIHRQDIQNLFFLILCCLFILLYLNCLFPMHMLSLFFMTHLFYLCCAICALCVLLCSHHTLDDDDVMAAGPFATGEHTQCPSLKKKKKKRKRSTLLNGTGRRRAHSGLGPTSPVQLPTTQ